MPDPPFLQALAPRRALDIALTRLTDDPVIALHGARSVGKSTLLSQVAAASGGTLVDLDDLALRDLVRIDPSAFVTGPSPVCIDDYQHAPEVLDAIKAELNRDFRPGRFVLTGSTRFEVLPRAAQSLTGRLHVFPVWPLSQGEIEGREENLLEALLTDPGSVATSSTTALDKAGYLDRVIAGGMPVPLSRKTAAARNRWFDDYVRLVIGRDIREVSRARELAQLDQLLRHLAGQTAQVLNVTKAAAGLGIDRTTAAGYVRLLESASHPHRADLDTGLNGWLPQSSSSKTGSRSPASIVRLVPVQDFLPWPLP